MFDIITQCRDSLKDKGFHWHESNINLLEGEIEIEILATTVDPQDIEKRIMSCFENKIAFDKVDIEVDALHDLRITRGDLTYPRPSKYDVTFRGIIEQPKMDNFQAEDIMQENYEDQLEESKCPDCKDGFYYPLFGPPEPCQTCQSHSDLDVDSSESCDETQPYFDYEEVHDAQPPEFCNTCDGTNYYLGHPQGTPGPCPDCNIDLKINSEDFVKDLTNILSTINCFPLKVVKPENSGIYKIGLIVSMIKSETYNGFMNRVIDLLKLEITQACEEQKSEWESTKSMYIGSVGLDKYSSEYYTIRLSLGFIC